MAASASRAPILRATSYVDAPSSTVMREPSGRVTFRMHLPLLWAQCASASQLPSLRTRTDRLGSPAVAQAYHRERRSGPLAHWLLRPAMSTIACPCRPTTSQTSQKKNDTEPFHAEARRQGQPDLCAYAGLPCHACHRPGAVPIDHTSDQLPLCSADAAPLSQVIPHDAADAHRIRKYITWASWIKKPGPTGGRGDLDWDPATRPVRQRTHRPYASRGHWVPGSAQVPARTGVPVSAADSGVKHGCASRRRCSPVGARFTGGAGPGPRRGCGRHSCIGPASPM